MAKLDCYMSSYNKKRLSMALCANADGLHKLNPRCFKHVNIRNLPIIYRNNTKAWMLTSLFQEWLQHFDREVTKKHGDNRVLLLIDNCPSHKVCCEKMVLKKSKIFCIINNKQLIYCDAHIFINLSMSC